MLIQGIGKLLADVEKTDTERSDIDDGSVSQLTLDDLSYQIDDESKREDISDYFHEKNGVTKVQTSFQNTAKKSLIDSGSR